MWLGSEKLPKGPTLCVVHHPKVLLGSGAAFRVCGLVGGSRGPLEEISLPFFCSLLPGRHKVSSFALPYFFYELLPHHSPKARGPGSHGQKCLKA